MVGRTFSLRNQLGQFCTKNFWMKKSQRPHPPQRNNEGRKTNKHTHTHTPTHIHTHTHTLNKRNHEKIWFFLTYPEYPELACRCIACRFIYFFHELRGSSLWKETFRNSYAWPLPKVNLLSSLCETLSCPMFFYLSVHLFP